jgi:hypothetical protein
LHSGGGRSGWRGGCGGCCSRRLLSGGGRGLVRGRGSGAPLRLTKSRQSDEQTGKYDRESAHRGLLARLRGPPRGQPVAGADPGAEVHTRLGDEREARTLGTVPHGFAQISRNWRACEAGRETSFAPCINSFAPGLRGHGSGPDGSPESRVIFAG